MQHSMEMHRTTVGKASISCHNQTEPSRHSKNCQSSGKISKNLGLRSREYKCGVKIIGFSTKQKILDSALNCIYYFSRWMGRSLVDMCLRPLANIMFQEERLNATGAFTAGSQPHGHAVISDRKYAS